MAGGRVYSSGTGGNSGSNLSVLFQNQKGTCASEPLDSLFLSGSSPSFLGTLFKLYKNCVMGYLYSSI